MGRRAHMSKAVVGWLCVGLLCAVPMAWAGEAAGEPAGVEALKKQLKELRQREDKVRRERDTRREKIRKSPDLAELRAARDKASEAYQAKKKTDPDYVAALEGESDARRALEQLVREQLAAGDDAKPIYTELESIDQKVSAFYFEEALARLELDHRYSPINCALRKDPELIKLSKAAAEADRAHRIKPDKEARDAARKAYEDARQAKLAATPEVQKLRTRIEEARKGRDELRKAERELHTKLGEIRRTIERGEDADIQAARGKLDDARKAVREAYEGEGLSALRKVRNETRDAFEAKARELMEADEALVELIKEREALRVQVRELEKKIREAQK